MSKPKILLNTSSWINLFETGLSSYLFNWFEVTTTPKVFDEIMDGLDFAEDAKTFKKYFDAKSINILQKISIPDQIKHEISISSGEIELVAAALNNDDFIIVIDDSKVYRILERVGIKYISSVHIVIDAYLTGHIDKKQALKLLEKLRICFKDETIDT
jgi:predicted nucleic acid-binding protein